MVLLWFLVFLALRLVLHCGHAEDVVLTIEPSWSTIFTGDSVTFTCESEGTYRDGYYAIRRDGYEFSPYNTNKNHTVRLGDPGYSGEYQCLAHVHGSTRDSNKVSLTVSDKDLILQSPASTLFEGESVSLRCRHRDQMKEKNVVFYKDGSPIRSDTNHQSNNTVQLVPDRSSYRCSFGEDQESDPITLKTEPQPKARVTSTRRAGHVVLSCFMRQSSGWKYFWYRGNKTAEPLNTSDVHLLSDGRIQVSGGGLYWCRGGRGDPRYYSDYSDPAVTYRPVVVLQSDWPQIYSGETVTLTCRIEDGGDAEWEYEWTTRSGSPSLPNEDTIRVPSSHSGHFYCRGSMRRETYSLEWSDAFTLRTSPNCPQPVLTVSPSWLSPGDSVTLNCSVEHPSAGWRFYWYQAVPDPAVSFYRYRYELLPGSTNGTEDGSYNVLGQMDTAGYVCRAGRGDPVYYSQYSNPTFVWSGDVPPAASLSVSPDRVQHFQDQLVSLSCGGNSTMWTVKRLYNSDSLISCPFWGTMTGSTCVPNGLLSGVYWCESGSGLFSNAVNITTLYGDTMLVSPVHPVAEGHPVTLGCKLKSDKVLHNVDFYKDNRVVLNATREELSISAVSKSDEGFYRCEGQESPGGRRTTSLPSWMAVKSVVGPASPGPDQNPPLPLLMVVGPVCGLLLIILLMLVLFHCRKSKGFLRSQRTNQSPATDHMINQDETRAEYAAPLHGGAVLYETVNVPNDDESTNVTYSVVELKRVSEDEDGVMYAQVNCRPKHRNNKGVSVEEETVYSEVKPGRAADQ